MQYNKKQHRYYLTRKTKLYVWLKWEYFGKMDGLSIRIPRDEFETDWEMALEKPKLYKRKEEKYE